MKKFWDYPLYLIFFAIYPILAMWATNIRFIPGSEIIRSLLISIGLIILLFAIFFWITRKLEKAALIAALIHSAFFVYGHIHSRISSWMIGSLNIGRQRYFMVLVIAILAILVILILRSRSNLKSLVVPLNIIGFVLLILPGYQILSFQSKNATNSAGQTTINEVQQTNSPITLSQPSLGYWPDIYYIILDSYTRADVLSECFAYDNQPFLDALAQRGFYVAQNSQTNFTITDLSLAASLNLQYPQDLGNSVTDAADEFKLESWVKNNVVRQSLKKAGYQIIGFETGYGISQWEDADHYYAISTNQQIINPFESMLLSTTMLKIVYDTRLPIFASFRMMLDTTYMQHRSRMLNILDQLDGMAGQDSPKFVFAHLLAPHSPFVFGADGELVIRNSPFTLNDDPESKDAYAYKDGYVKQVEYLNKRVLEFVDQALTKSKNPPIIIIQGDHGASRFVTSKWGRSYILDAYYLPTGQGHLYDTISPVNSFRVIFNDLFGTSLPLLEDKAFYTTHATLDTLKPITGSKNKCNPAYLP